MANMAALSFDMDEGLDQKNGMVAFVDPKSHKIIDCNHSLSETLGIAKEQILEKTVFEIFTRKSRRPAEKVYQSFLQTQSVPEMELELAETNGKKLPVTLRLSGALDTKGNFQCTRFSLHENSALKKVQRHVRKETRELRGKVAHGLREVRKRSVKLQKEVERRKTTQFQLNDATTLLRRQAKETRILAKKLISVQEGERRRLARDLHDETNQKLALLSLQVAALKQGIPMKTIQLHKHLQSVLDNISSLASEVRQLAHQLHPAVLEHLGFVEAMEAHIAEISHAHEFQIIFRHRNVPQTIPLELSMCLYRVAQECLGNVIKHAQAHTIKLSYVGFSKSLRLSIKDDGKGMTAKQFRCFSQGLGFVSMRERVRLVKGRLRIKSKPQKGTEIHITVPRVEKSP